MGIPNIKLPHAWDDILHDPVNILEILSDGYKTRVKSSKWHTFVGGDVPHHTLLSHGWRNDSSLYLNTNIDQHLLSLVTVEARYLAQISWLAAFASELGNL